MVSVSASRMIASILLTCFLSMIAGLAGLAFISAQPVSATAPITEATAPSETDPSILMPIIDQSSEAALVIETNRQRHLYELNTTVSMNIPVSAKLMTALIACERLSLDTQVTISSVAAEAASNERTLDGVTISSGDKYPLRYLLYRLICYDSDAAALAIAEQISSIEEKFVELMNAKAANLQMTGTVYKNCTGQPVYPELTDPPDNSAILQDLQYTTLNDLAILAYQAVSNQTLKEILATPSQFIILGESNLAFLQNRLSDLWTRSEGMIKGAFYCELLNRTYMVAFGSVNTISLVAITAAGSRSEAEDDLIALFQGCKDFYISTPLVVAGDPFTGGQEQTIDGEVFGLNYKQTVYYVRPASSIYLKDTILYKSFGPFSRPIQRSMTVGQVTFELFDGTKIAVDVVPDRQILSSISIVDYALNELQRNSNLTILLVISGCLLVLVLFWQIIAGATRLTRLIHLIILEKRIKSSNK